jgi:hypothetical protein
VNTSNSRLLDLSFIPASQRESTRPDLQEQLVVVGKVNRKRKRQQNSIDPTKRSKVSTRENQSEQEVDLTDDGVTPFDYSVADNILDSPEQNVREGPGRQKVKKKGTS